MIACHHGLQFGVGTEDDARFAGDILHARVGASWFLPVRSNVPSCTKRKIYATGLARYTSTDPSLRSG